VTTTFIGSPNHASRNGVKITDIVLHWMAGNLAGCDATFQNAARQTSAHYGIEETTVHQYVLDADVAWHSGNWDENQRSIGIEHSAQPGRNASVTTIATSVALIVSLCRKYGISPDHIYSHNRFYATQCPGTLPITSMIAQVKAQLAPAPVKPVIAGPAYPGYPTSTQSYGDYVTRMIQTRMRVLGYAAVVVDGVYGSVTAGWVGLFQSRHGIVANGVVNAATWKALFA
jgi:N-acetylmuramoyl-L-alanine amidase/Putative peptidoglycan binding domain